MTPQQLQDGESREIWWAQHEPRCAVRTLHALRAMCYGAALTSAPVAINGLGWPEPWQGWPAEWPEGMEAIPTEDNEQ